MAASGCGIAFKFGYGQGPALAFLLLDGYVGFDDAQSLRLRTGLDEWFTWHRRTQLPDYADLLARVQGEAGADTTAEKMCGWSRAIRARVDTAVERAVPALADVMVTISTQQIASLEKKYADNNAEYRGEFVQKDLVKRRRAAVEREIERAERLYGRLDAAQRELVVRSVEQSPFDAEATYAERLRRQQDAVSVLRRLAANRASVTRAEAEAEAELRAYVQRLERSPREEHRRYSERLLEHNCTFAAQLHNASNAEQRRHAARRLKGWEDDVRALAAEAG